MTVPSSHKGNTATWDTGNARINITKGNIGTIDYKHEVALGIIEGSSLWNKFGYNVDVDTATSPEIVASFGGSFSPVVTETTISLVSSSAADDSGGTGCNSVVIYGLNADWEEVVELVTLDGTTPVTTTSTWVGINRLAMYICGTGQVNAGTITATAVTGGRTMAVMPLAEGVTQQCLFYVAQGHTFVMEYLLLGAGRNASNNPYVTFKVYVYSAISNGIQEVFRKTLDTEVEVYADIEPSLPFPITEKTVIWVEVSTDQNNTEATCRFSGILVQDEA